MRAAQAQSPQASGCGGQHKLGLWAALPGSPSALRERSACSGASAQRRVSQITRRRRRQRAQQGAALSLGHVAALLPHSLLMNPAGTKVTCVCVEAVGSAGMKGLAGSQ